MTLTNIVQIPTNKVNFRKIFTPCIYPMLNTVKEAYFLTIQNIFRILYSANQPAPILASQIHDTRQLRRWLQFKVGRQHQLERTLLRIADNR